MSWLITYDWNLVVLVGNKDVREIELMKKVAVVA